jgi:uncharacterized 2Fe-2S/4Fe-4S cluster protein (DUF4445 family)
MTTVSPGDKCKIRFLPDDIEVSVNRGTLLLDAAISGGVHIAASCGGTGICGTCKVKIEKGDVESLKTEALSDGEYQKGIRLACQSKALTDVTVFIPLKSKLDKSVKIRDRVETSGVLAAGWRISPPLSKYFLQLPPPTLADNISDTARVIRGLKNECGINDLPVDLEIIRKLPEVLREDHWNVTVTTLLRPAIPDIHEGRARIVNVEPGDTRSRLYALAIDIGTTTVCGQLLDLNKGEVVADSIVFNQQINFGADIIARIAFIQKPGVAGLKTLQQAIVNTINQVIDELISQSKIDRSDIAFITAAGNPTMTQILFGLTPKYIRLSPYTPVANALPLVKAVSLGLNLASYAYLYAFPAVSSYIGGDIVSGVIAAGMHQTSKLTFFMDIGTNGEIVIGKADWMVTASCSAGPAFEGGGIKYGMVAVNGAIQDFSINCSTLEPVYHTIGNEKPKGICGSGLIAILAALLEACVIGQNGKFDSTLDSPRIRHGQDGYEYVVAWSSESQFGQDITISEADIDNLIRSKAAMYAGCHTLSRSVNINCNDFEQVILAGNFGSALDIEKAITIGLLPDLPRDRFVFIGNGSLSGARLACFSIDFLNDSVKVGRMMTNIELSENLDFTQNYMAALFLPHTEEKNFPTISARINDCLKINKFRSK